MAASSDNTQATVDLLMQIIQSNFNEEYVSMKLLRPRSLFTRAMQNEDIRADMRRRSTISDLEFGPTEKQASVEAIKLIWGTARTVKEWSSKSSAHGQLLKEQLAKTWSDNLGKAGMSVSMVNKIIAERLDDFFAIASRVTY